MTALLTASQIEAVLERHYGHYRPEAIKRGRNPAFPYVPVYRFASSPGSGQTTQIRGRAYATRDEAVACAERHIANLREHFRSRLTTPHCRALRVENGLPAEIEAVQ